MATPKKAAAPAPAVSAHDVLVELEFTGRHNSDPACPFCSAKQPLDPANPRDWESHKPDCKLAAAIAATA
jgi:hypothetical protein